MAERNIRVFRGRHTLLQLLEVNPTPTNACAARLRRAFRVANLHRLYINASASRKAKVIVSIGSYEVTRRRAPQGKSSHLSQISSHIRRARVTATPCPRYAAVATPHRPPVVSLRYASLDRTELRTPFRSSHIGPGPNSPALPRSSREAHLACLPQTPMPPPNSL